MFDEVKFGFWLVFGFEDEGVVAGEAREGDLGRLTPAVTFDSGIEGNGNLPIRALKLFTKRDIYMM
jgi:hypothetical protein